MSGLSSTERLKLELMQGGLAVSSSALAHINARVGERPLTLADYASTSGVSLVLEGDVWVNAPILKFNSNFVSKEPMHTLLASSDQLVVRAANGADWPVHMAPVPDYHEKSNDQHKAFTEYVHTHTDRARISPIRGCAMRCTFCDIPFEFKGKYWMKPSRDLIAALDCALHDPLQPAAHVLISGGTPAAKHYSTLRQTYLDVLEAFPGTPIDIMMVPHDEIIDLEALDKAGLNELSLNLEIYDLDRAREIMPEKYKHGLSAYLDFIEKAVERLSTRPGHNRVRSMLLVGLEDEERTLAGVQALVDRGCAPVLSPFRPDPITTLAKELPPSADLLERVYLRAREICERGGVNLGPRCMPCMHNTLTFPSSVDAPMAHGAPFLI